MNIFESIGNFFSRLFGGGDKSRVTATKGWGDRCEAALEGAEQKTGLKATKSVSVSVIKPEREQWSKTLARNVGVFWSAAWNEFVCGLSGSGHIKVAMDKSGYIASQILEHEMGHIVAECHGLQRAGQPHCPEFHGKLWNWG